MWRMIPLLLLLALAPGAHAQDVIRHCVSPGGTPVFTDQPCAQVHAIPAAPDGTPAAPLPTCPQTADALKSRVANAFLARDANALAGLMQWRGYGQGEGVADVRRLMQLVRQPLVSLQVVADGIPGEASRAAGSPASSGAQPDVLVVRTAADATAPGERRDFALVGDSGCLWLAP